MTKDQFEDLTSVSADAADDTAKAFEAAGERIAAALEQAAQSGELSFRSLAESAAQDLARIAIHDLVIAPLEAALGNIGKGGGASTGKPMTINMNISGASDAQSFTRSQGQISAALARAVASGNKYL